MSAFQMGLLAAAAQAPFLIVSLPAGVWVDRVRRRPIMILTDIGSGVLLLTIPVVALLGRLGYGQLLLVAFGVGALVALGEVAGYAYVPTLVDRDRLVEANSRIQVSYSAAESAGPGVGGALVQLVSAPAAILIDALSFFWSARMTSAIQLPEPAPADGAPAEPLSRSIGQGMGFLFRHRLLRVIMLVSIGSGFFADAFTALLVLYFVRELHLSALAIGLIFAIAGLSAIPGAMLAGHVAARIGVGHAIVVGWLIEAAARLLAPAAAGPIAAVLVLLIVGQSLYGAAGTVANIHQWTMRQAVTSDALQGRVTAAHRFLTYGSGAIGALIGGGLGAAIGLRRAVLLFAVANLVVRIPAVWSALWTVKTQPDAATDVSGHEAEVFEQSRNLA